MKGNLYIAGVERVRMVQIPSTNAPGISSRIALQHADRVVQVLPQVFRRGCLKMSGNVTELRPKQQEAILALLTNGNVEQAARAVWEPNR